MLRKRWLALPELIKFMAVNFADGVILGWTCGLLLIWFDVCRIGSLLASYDSALLTTLFFTQSGLLFGKVPSPQRRSTTICPEDPPRFKLLPTAPFVR